MAFRSGLLRVASRLDWLRRPRIGNPLRWVGVRVVLVVVACIAGGCASTRGDWSRAQQANTLDAYVTFLRGHPSSEFTAEAESRIRDIDRDVREALLTRARTPSPGVTVVKGDSIAIPGLPRDGTSLDLFKPSHAAVLKGRLAGSPGALLYPGVFASLGVTLTNMSDVWDVLLYTDGGTYNSDTHQYGEMKEVGSFDGGVCALYPEASLVAPAKTIRFFATPLAPLEFRWGSARAEFRTPASSEPLTETSTSVQSVRGWGILTYVGGTGLVEIHSPTESEIRLYGFGGDEVDGR